MHNEKIKCHGMNVLSYTFVSLLERLRIFTRNGKCRMALFVFKIEFKFHLFLYLIDKLFQASNSISSIELSL